MPRSSQPSGTVKTGVMHREYDLKNQEPCNTPNKYAFLAYPHGAQYTEKDSMASKRASIKQAGLTSTLHS